MENTKIVKIYSDILHFLPFVATKNRSENYEVTRKYGKKTLKLTSSETLNSYDLITFAQLLDYINTKGYCDGQYMEGRPVIETTLDLAYLIKSRNISNKLTTRKQLHKSLNRLFNTTLEYNTDGEISKTRYFYNYDTEENYDSVKVLMNKDFFDICLKQGMLFNYSRLLEYKKNNYAILLDSYLQGTKTKTRRTRQVSKNGKYIYEYEYKNTYNEDVLFEKLFSDTIILNKKRFILSKSFKTINKIGKLPLYVFNKIDKKWIKTPKITT